MKCINIWKTSIPQGTNIFPNDIIKNHAWIKDLIKV